MKKMIFRIILSIAGFLLVAEGIVAASISNLNLGIVMPFVIGIPLIVVGVFYPLLSSWWSVSIVGKILKYAMISAYVLFALLFAATTTLILTNSKTTAEPEKADVLIVLGAGIRGDLPSVVLRNRLDRALDCYEQNPDLLIIVSGGMGEGESSTEASVMKKWLVAAGVPADSIIEEGKSQSTEENFIFSFDIINRLFNGSGAAAESNPRVAFVTTRFHVFRASRIAKKLGFNTFTELAYCRQTRNCYDAKDVSAFRSRIVRDIVPVVCRLKDMQKERIGIDDMKIYDDPFAFKEGNPKPDGSSEDILAAGKKMYEQMSPETGEFINFMYDNALMDVLSAKGKAAGGYCTEILEYKSPFIFSNFNGTSGDVDVLTHEAGHAFAYYSVRDKMELCDQISPTMESCEVHSMSMEFFAWPWHELFYGSDAVRSRFVHLESALVFLPYGTMVDEFQHIVYDSPELTPAERNKKWLALERKYRPYMDFGDVDFYSNGRGWQRQLHIYLYPFYYIDYCLAQTAALEFWSLSQKDYKDAWQRYLRFVSFGGKKSFKELCAAAGIDDPFGEHALNGVARTANAWLDSNG